MNAEINTVVAVVGPGAIGTTVAAALYEVGRTPLLCGRTPRDHLTLQDGDRFITVPGPVQTNPAQITRTADLVFLAVKSTQIDAAAEWLRALTGPETVVCVLQNGVEQLDRLATYSLPGQIVPAVVWFPAQAQSDGLVRLRGDARLSLPDTSASRVVATVLQGTWCSVDLAANFSSLAWRKLMQNAVAGLMALTHRRSGMFGRADIARLTLAYLCYQRCESDPYPTPEIRSRG
ncbi:oxidoreductase [Klebsiella sp. NPDC088457]